MIRLVVILVAAIVAAVLTLLLSPQHLDRREKSRMERNDRIVSCLRVRDDPRECRTA